MKRVILDATTLTKLQICDEYFNLSTNLNLIPLSGKGKGLELGSMMHEMLATFYRLQRDGKSYDERTSSAVITGQTFITGCEICIAHVSSLKEQVILPKCTVHTDHPFTGLETASIEEAHDCILNFHQYCERWKNDSWTTINVEHVKGKVIYEDDELSLLWKAKIDWEVDNLEGFFSVDHKTMSRREDTLSLNNQFIGQSIVTEQTKVFINKIGTQKSLKPEEKFERVAINYTKERIAEWINECAQWAYELIALQESGVFKHRFTSCDRKYGHCLFKKVCSGQPTDRERLIMEQFKVNDKVWDVTNED